MKKADLPLTVGTRLKSRDLNKHADATVIKINWDSGSPIYTLSIDPGYTAIKRHEHLRKDFKRK